jgi:hypothetical protein
METKYGFLDRWQSPSVIRINFSNTPSEDVLEKLIEKDASSRISEFKMLIEHRDEQEDDHKPVEVFIPVVNTVTTIIFIIRGLQGR